MQGRLAGSEGSVFNGIGDLASQEPFHEGFTVPFLDHPGPSVDTQTFAQAGDHVLQPAEFVHHVQFQRLPTGEDAAVGNFTGRVRRHAAPAGDLDILGDLGMSARDLAALLDEDAEDLYPDELLSEVARRLGFGALFDEAVGLSPA